jgi:membrane protease subunit HflK
MYIDMMQQIMANSSKVLVDQKGSNSLLYLPLDKLIQSTNPGATQDMSTAAKAATADQLAHQQAAMPEPTTTQSVRDTLRGREREPRP